MEWGRRQTDGVARKAAILRYAPARATCTVQHYDPKDKNFRKECGETLAKVVGD